MATPTMTTRPRARLDLARAASGLTLLGALLVLPIALLHPQGNSTEQVNGLSSWTLLHVMGAFGFATIAAGAALRLAGGPPNAVAAAGFAGVVVFGTVLGLALAIDGYASPYFAERDGFSGTTLEALREAVLEIERAGVTVGFGGFGLAGALVTASQLGRGAVLMRIGRAIATLGFLAVACAGILYLGLGTDTGFFFAGMPVVTIWLVIASVVGLARPEGLRAQPGAAAS